MKIKKITKIFAATGLAMIMGAGVLVGMLAPIGVSQADIGSAEDLFEINLNSQTDKVVYKTESGFEIKKHNIEGNTVEQSSVHYFTLGNYNGKQMNWLIIASSPIYGDILTPAGEAIYAECSNQQFSFMTTSDLFENQFLVISENVIENPNYLFSITAHPYATQDLPGWSNYGWAGGGSDGIANGNYYGGLLLDELTDYHTSSTEWIDLDSSTNDFLIGSTFGLSSFIGNKIVQNSNFSPYYGFCMSASMFQTYVPSNVWLAKNFSGVSTSYILKDITGSVSKTMDSYKHSTTSGSKTGHHFAPRGTGVATVQSNYVTTAGELTTYDVVKVDGVVSANTAVQQYFTLSSKSMQYLFEPQATYTLQDEPVFPTKYIRLAMVIDISKF